MRLLALLAVILAFGTPAALSGEHKHDEKHDKHPNPHPTPHPAPHPAPQPAPQPTPHPAPQPGNTPHPAPQPTPHPAPQPGNTPHPAPQPGNTPPLSTKEKEEQERQIKERNAAVERQIKEQNATVAAVRRAQDNKMLIDHALVLINDRKQARARSYLNKVIERYPTEPAAKEARKLLAMLQRWDIAAVQRKKEEENKKAESFVQHARKLIGKGKQAGAHYYLEQVPRRWPTSPAAKEARKLIGAMEEARKLIGAMSYEGRLTSVVLKVDPNQITVDVEKPVKKPLTFKLTPNTEIVLKGKPAKPTDLKPGMRVRVTTVGEKAIATEVVVLDR
jgi:hypothetical protein